MLYLNYIQLQSIDDVEEGGTTCALRGLASALSRREGWLFALLSTLSLLVTVCETSGTKCIVAKNKLITKMPGMYCTE